MPDPAETVVRFGFHRGKRLADLGDRELRSLRDWCADPERTSDFGGLIDDIEIVLEERQGLPLELDDPRKPRRGAR
jgi:hypothetical protein